MSLTSKFNGGKLNSTGIDEQYNDKFWSKGAIKEAAKKRTFTQLGDRLTQPKHFGQEIVKERQFPILHELNRLDGGIDATTANLIEGTYYAYDANGEILADGIFESRNYEADAQDVGGMPGSFNAHKAATDATGSVKVLNGTGTLFGGDAEYSVLRGAFPTLTEDGGNVNAVNTKSITVRGTVSEFGAHMKFTQRSIDMDSRTGVLAQKTQALGELKGDIFEAQVQSDLLNASELNRTFGGNKLDLASCNAESVLTYGDLRAMELELKRARVPTSTKLISGSTKIGTKVVASAYYVYVGQELTPMLEDMEHMGEKVWAPIETYADAGAVAVGEIGKIGRFRFIEVENMQRYRGVGVENADDGSVNDTAGYYASLPVNGTGAEHFDVFPILFVGTDSFATVGFEGDSSKIKTAMPKADAHMDPFGKTGSMSISWYFGTLIYRAERIRQLAVVANIA